MQKDLWSITSFLENKNYKFNKENILTQLPEKFIEEAIPTSPLLTLFSRVARHIAHCAQLLSNVIKAKKRRI